MGDHAGYGVAVSSDAELTELALFDLARLVGVESPSGDVAAITRSAETVAALIGEWLGRPAELVDGPAGPHVHWSGGGDAARPRARPSRHRVPHRNAGGSAVHGRRWPCHRSGVFDMKAGIVQAIHAVASLDDASGVELLFSSDEEVGSDTSRALIEERALACGAVLVLEPSADGGALKTGRKGVGTFEVVIHGRAAHAGLEPEKGVNTLIEASHQVLAIAGLGSAEPAPRVTPTVASAGTAENVVPAEANIRVDVRVQELARRTASKRRWRHSPPSTRTRRSR